MDVKVCDYCGEKIKGYYLEIEKRYATNDAVGWISAGTIGTKPWPRDIHLNVKCMTRLMNKEVYSDQGEQ